MATVPNLWSCEDELSVKINDLLLELEAAVIIADESERLILRADMGIPDFDTFPRPFSDDCGMREFFYLSRRSLFGNIIEQ